MTVLQVLAGTVLLLVCWGGLQAVGQELGNAELCCLATNGSLYIQCSRGKSTNLYEVN